MFALNEIRAKNALLAKVAALAVALLVLSANPDRAAAASFTLPFLAPNYSVLDIKFANSPPLLSNQRALVFSTPSVAPSTFTLFNGPAFYDPTGFGSAAFAWPTNQTSYYTVNTVGPNNQPVHATSSVDVISGVSVYPQTGTLLAALTNSFSTNLPMTSAVSDVKVQFLVQGGVGDGRTLNLNGKWAAGQSTSGDPAPVGDGGAYVGYYDYVASAEVHLVIDWGTDPTGTPHTIVITFGVSATLDLIVEPNYPGILPFSTISSHLLQTPDPAAYAQSVANDYQTQITSQTLHLTGAAPEFLVLYDFNGTNSVKPLALIPRAALTLDANGGLTGVYPSINQYDAGVAFSLPKRFKNHNVPPQFIPGGNACGPTSLGMALNVARAPGDPLSIYNNTMQYGLVTTDDFSNAFEFSKAKAWLEGATNYEHFAFSSVSPIPGGSTAYSWFDTKTNRFAGDWAMIDGVLTGLKQPVLFRVDLGSGNGLTTNTIGGGHVILLLGKGHSDLVGSFYGLSGDYYIVGDPAGHFFANLNGTHYGQVTNLMAQCVGINYGGVLAVYPSELLQESIIDKRTGQPRITALTFPSPFKYQQDQEQCPAALMVTDPLGRQTGILPDGTVIENIPQSWYQPDVADEEDEGTTTYLQDGAKTVVINSPSQGAYQILLTGTADGLFSLGWGDVVTGPGQFLPTVVTNSITLGQMLHYPFTEGTAAPSLGILLIKNQVVLSWPASAPGFSLQSSSSLSTAGNWSAGFTPALAAGSYVVTNALSSQTIFYRLIK